MRDRRLQRYRVGGVAGGVSPAVLNAAIEAGKIVTAVNRDLVPIFTLRHLAHLVEVDYRTLRRVVSRDAEDPYRVFSIRKRTFHKGKRRFRVICVPEPALMTVQRWIAQHVLNHGESRVHSASTAYAPDSTLVDAVEPHLGCRWLIKVDIENFFESISEISAYRTFRELGYQPLIAFEMARLCTRLGKPTNRRWHRQWTTHGWSGRYSIGAYSSGRLGHLPQGAPTSPMLANMAMYDADQALAKLAGHFGLEYTRYADDLTFSASGDFDRVRAADIVHRVYRILGQFGFSPNIAKTRVVPPRARKVVLGLLAHHDVPCLPREFKARMRMHLYYLKDARIGPVKHAARRGFVAVSGLRRHLFGLAAYAAQVEPDYGALITEKLKQISWPS